MLNALRNGISNLIVKFFLVVIILSFVLWGVGDIFRGRSNTAVAEVGDQTIERSTLDRALQYALSQQKNMPTGEFGEILKNLLRQQVINQLINDSLLTQESQRLGLTISDELVAQALSSMPMLQGEDGQFSRERFKMLLRNSGMTEKYYVSSMKRDMAAGALIDALTTGGAIPPQQTELLFRFRNEQRIADVLMLTDDMISSVPQPSETELMQYYEQQSSRFAAPEYRSITWIELSPDQLSEQISVSDGEIQAAYEDHVAEFTTEETRDVEQAIFDSKDAATAAYEAITSGGELSKGISFATLGTVTKSALPENTGTAVFALSQGAITQPIETEFGFHLFRVNAIHPQVVPPLAEIRDQLTKRILSAHAEEALYDLTTRLEDALAAGTSLEDIAKDFSLKLSQVSPVSEEGLRQDGNTEPGLPPYTTFTKAAFALDEGEHSQLNETANGYYVLRVDKVVPARERALDEVRGTVVAAWKAKEKQQMLADQADKLAGALSKGKSFEKAAQQKGISLRTTGPFTRAGKQADGTTVADIPAPLISAIFTTDEKGITSAVRADENTYYIGKVRQIIPASDTNAAEPKDQIEAAIAQQYYYEHMQQYLAHLRTRYPVRLFTHEPATGTP